MYLYVLLIYMILSKYRMQFQKDAGCSSANEMKNEYIDVKLNSLYIADINQFIYPELNDIILKILRNTIVPLFICSIVGNSDQSSDEYKNLAYKWCKERRILKIIVKSQQYELAENSKWDRDISKLCHIEGSVYEKISHIAICYTSIDNRICGGNLDLAFDSSLDNVWTFKPKPSLCICFPNMYHKISEISLSNFGKNKQMVTDEEGQKQKRRILAFFLCGEEEYFIKTKAFKALNFIHKYGHQEINESNKRLMLLPLLTTNDVLPLDKMHCLELLKQTLKQFYNIPDEIITIISGFMMDGTLLRDEAEMERNAIKIRTYRRYYIRFETAYKPMVAD